MTSQATGFWVDVPPLEELPSTGIVVTTVSRLRDGLIRGDSRYAPWIAAKAAEKGWDEVLFVGGSSISRFQDGKLVPQAETVEGLAAARAEREKQSEGALGRTIAGLAMVGAGAGLAGAGVGLNMASYTAGIPKVGEALPGRDDYESQYSQNRTGFGIAVAGGVTAAAGLVLTVISLATAPKSSIAVAPYLITDGRAVAFGVAGRLP